ncbi:MAG: hypothetical protein ACR2P6_03040 [Gammaproteobacteria bacterium]
MRQVVLIFSRILALLVIAAVVGILVFTPAQRPPSETNVIVTTEKLWRGGYLFTAVLGCAVCHSERNWELYGAPPIEPFGGGRACEESADAQPGLGGDFPGTVCFRNISQHKQYGIGAWTDGEIMRAVREGVGRDGEALFPTMPYFIYRNISDYDLDALVAYMRSLPEVDNQLPPTRLDFPVNVAIRFAPQPLSEEVPAPAMSDRVARGRYLAEVARCGFCHTQRDKRTRMPLEGKGFAGGAEFSSFDGIVYSPNLTPHETGIGDMSESEFVRMFKKHIEPKKVAKEKNSIMPWASYAQMTKEDLGSIYHFLTSLPPVDMKTPDET